MHTSIAQVSAVAAATLTATALLAAPAYASNQGCRVAKVTVHPGRRDRARCLGGKPDARGHVKIRQGKHTYRVGRFETDDDGNADVTFRVPAELKPGHARVLFLTAHRRGSQLLRVKRRQP